MISSQRQNAQVAKDRRHAGGRIKRELDAKGELVAGLREIDEAEAEVVREIFRDYADGLSPRAIAAKLNALAPALSAARSAGCGPEAFL